MHAPAETANVGQPAHGTTGDIDGGGAGVDGGGADEGGDGGGVVVDGGGGGVVDGGAFSGQLRYTAPTASATTAAAKRLSSRARRSGSARVSVLRSKSP